MRVLLAFCLFIILTVACTHAPQSNDNKNPDAVPPVTSSNGAPIDAIDLTRIDCCLASKGRVQDTEYSDLEVVDQLIRKGPECIPFLISKLEDETKLEGQVMCYWSTVTVGDIALIILSDFFTDSTWKNTTIPGVGWDQMLERTSRDITGEQVLGEYIEKDGRIGIKRKWEKIWKEHKDRLYWDEGERCFKV